jgi:hypothetical protein
MVFSLTRVPESSSKILRVWQANKMKTTMRSTFRHKKRLLTVGTCSGTFLDTCRIVLRLRERKSPDRDAGLQSAKIRIFGLWGFQVALWMNFCIGINTKEVIEFIRDVSEGLNEGVEVA